MTNPLKVTGYGAITAVGLTAPQTCAAIRASIAGFKESSFYYESIKIDPIIGALVPALPSPQQGSLIDRLVAMASIGIIECLQHVPIPAAQTALLLGVREPFRANTEQLKDWLLPKIQERLQIYFHPLSQLFPEGNAAVFNGLLLARELLASGAVRVCLVGGVDSYLNVDDLNRFETSYRLKSKRIPQGFIPGEGAAFVAVTSLSNSSPSEILGLILGIGIAQENYDATVLGDGQPTGKGLQRALETTIQDAQLPESRITLRVSDLNGEYYRGMESLLAFSRFYRTHREHLEIWHPADCVGEIGAATGALALIVAIAGFRKGYAPGNIAMCETSSDGGLRAGCLVTIPSLGLAGSESVLTVDS